jgi:hypothetical protein
MPYNRYHAKEYPSGTGYSAEGASLSEINVMFPTADQSELAQLMSAIPFADIETTPAKPYGTLFALAEMLCTPDEYDVLQMLYGGNLSQSEAGMLLARSKSRSRAYSKTWVRKLRNSATEKIKLFYEDYYGTDGLKYN